MVAYTDTLTSGHLEDKGFGSSQSSLDGLLLRVIDGVAGKEDGNTWAWTLTKLIGSPVKNARFS